MDIIQQIVFRILGFVLPLILNTETVIQTFYITYTVAFFYYLAGIILSFIVGSFYSDNLPDVPLFVSLGLIVVFPLIALPVLFPQAETIEENQDDDFI